MIPLLSHWVDYLLIPKDSLNCDVSVGLCNEITPLKSAFGQLALNLIIELVALLKADLAFNCDQVFNLCHIFSIQTLYLCQPKWWCFFWVEDFKIRVDDDPTLCNRDIIKNWILPQYLRFQIQPSSHSTCLKSSSQNVGCQGFGRRLPANMAYFTESASSKLGFAY